MGAVTFAAFDPKPLRLGTVMTFTATTAVIQGHVVGFAASGTSNAVVAATGGTAATGITPVGVALHSAGAGAKVSVAMYGSVVKVLAALDNADIDTGSLVSAGATAGMVITKPAGDSIILGIALSPILRSAKGYILITGPVYSAAGE
jgi:hypothetical protein